VRLLTAIRFLTIIPMPRPRKETVEHMVRAAAFYPLVGGLVGGVLAGVAYTAALVWPPGTVAAVVVVAWAVLTGGLHLDGLADVSDGLGGGYTPARRLEIMKDVHLGAFGAVAVVCALALKIGFAAALEDVRLLKALVAAPVLGRFVQVGLIATFPSARTEGMAATFKRHLRPVDTAAAAATGLAVVFVLYGVWGPILLAGVAGVAAAAGAVVSRLLGGLTGDAYGALCEAAELVTLAVLALPWAGAFG
jgi:adenosylcobinamide-GDP ribazoletransferase